MRLPAAPIKRSSDWVLQLINIVFLLLLFFLVNGTIASQQDAQVEPPKSIMVMATNPPGDAVYIAADGSIKYGGAISTVPQIVSRQEKNTAGKIVPIKIVADRRLQAVKLLDVLRDFRAAGAADISLITVRDSGS